jgi:Ca-activated chloride channel family protein
MKLIAHLDLGVVGLEQDDELTLMVELTAPTPPTNTPRPPATLQVVLDRSGSMRGDRLQAATDAMCALVDRLSPTDNFGVVAFDHEVDVVVPAGLLTDRAAAKSTLVALTARRRTDLSGGYLRGLQEATRVAGEAGATVLLLSDGQANAGVTDPDRLGQVAAGAQSKRITTTALGLGLSYDENLLAAVARGGGGNLTFAEHGDDAAAQLCGEVDGLLQQVAQAVSLHVRMTPHVQALALLNDLPAQQVPGGVTVELGSLLAGETRRLLLHLKVPGIAALGLAQVAELVLTSVTLPELVQQTVTLPVHVNVVPGDQAAGRIPDPVVSSERLFQQSQASKRRASEMLRRNDSRGASRLLHDTAERLSTAASSLPAAHAGELRSEMQIFSDLAGEVDAGFAERGIRGGLTDAAQKSRMRGRRQAASLVVLRRADGGDALELERWRLERLRRHADEAGVRLRTSAPNNGEVARALADRLGPQDALFGFFDAAAGAGGFDVRRAQ